MRCWRASSTQRGMRMDAQVSLFSSRLGAREAVLSGAFDALSHDDVTPLEALSWCDALRPMT